jgi:hypothetical protein
LGDEPVVFVNNDNIQYYESPYEHQDMSYVTAVRSLTGYAGNNRLNHDDLESVTVHLNGRSNDIVIDMNSVQRLHCNRLDEDVTGSFALQFLNTSISLSTSTTVASFTSLLAAALQDTPYSVSVVGPDRTLHICNSTDETLYTEITFDTPVGETLPIMQVINEASVKADVFPVIYPIDSRAVVDATLGMYELKFTPTIAGEYDIYVKIEGVDVSTDLTTGSYVTPAQEYAATSTHNISAIVVEGVREYFTVQLRDVYGNEVAGPLESSSSFVLEMTGTSDECQSDEGSPTSTVSSIIPVSIMNREPYTDGVYSMYYDPTVAGEYNMSVKLVTQGGLLATYYKKSSESDPVLASKSHLHDGKYHTPYWCDGLQAGNYSTSWYFGSIDFCDTALEGCGCDSTRLDSSIAFDWGNATPLPFD